MTEVNIDSDSHFKDVGKMRKKIKKVFGKLITEEGEIALNI